MNQYLQKFWWPTLLGSLFLTTCSSAAAQPSEYPIQTLPLSAVKVRGEIWARRIDTNREVTIPSNFRKCEQTGRIDNFAKAGGLMSGPFQGRRYDDSDVFKMIEGASYALLTSEDPELETYLDELIEKIAAAQETDGYLFTCRTINPDQVPESAGDRRWSYLAHSHELYNVGHLYEAAVAHFQATGKRSLLNVAIKNADLIDSIFGPGSEQRKEVPGHQEIEIGLVKLSRITGNDRYLKLARFFLDQRGQRGRGELYGEYSQDHQPVLVQQAAVGHAVRALYMYCAMTDIAALADDDQYVAATSRLWEDIVFRKMYLTGGVGSSRAGEAFGPAYDLPNASAYNETCAAIGLALFNHRMFRLHGDSKYLDVLERVIYNGFLAGVSLQGDHFFYPNPLACDGRSRFNQGTLGRSPWFSCSCCPVNIARFVPTLGQFIYATRDDNIYVNLFMDSQATLTTGTSKLTLDQETQYPWDGNVTIGIQMDEPANFTMRLRIPGWAANQATPGGLYRYQENHMAPVVVDVNGKTEPARVEKGFVVLTRQWQNHDQIHMKIPMPIRRVVAHDAVKANLEKVALQRGPIVYCIEAVDHDGAVHDMYLPGEEPLTASFEPNLLGGLVAIKGQAQRLVRRPDKSVAPQPTPLRAIPYYAWAHREIGEMAVWMSQGSDDVALPPSPTIASTSNATASHTWSADSVNAVIDQVVPQSSADQQVPRHTWWNHKGTREWVQLDFAQRSTVSAVEVYWFDDTGTGNCRVPSSWRLFFRDGQNWQPVKTTSPYSIVKDEFNRLTFETVNTDALRLEVTLQPNFSGGILEWRVR